MIITKMNLIIVKVDTYSPSPSDNCDDGKSKKAPA